MWVLDPPGGYQGKTRFLGRPLAKVPQWEPEKVFFGIRQRFVARDRGQAQGCHTMGVVGGPCGYPAGKVGILGKLVFREIVGTGVGGCSDYG